MLCSKCGHARGKHQATSYHCPDNGRFSTTNRFSLAVDRMDPTDLKALTAGNLEVLEGEVARRVLKQVESVLAVYDLQSKATYNRQELIQSLDLVKRGYNL
jgi:hypothetical protein